MKRLPLTKGLYAQIDDDDFERASKYSWHVGFNFRGKAWYAKGRVNGKQQYLHRFIINAPTGVQVDHRNHNTLDNRKKNLRLCTRQQNAWNQRRKSVNKSGYIGVSYDVKHRFYVAQIRIKGQKVFLGYFADPKKAANAYLVAAKKSRGEFVFVSRKAKHPVLPRAFSEVPQKEILNGLFD
jgi:hypothetical protein